MEDILYNNSFKGRNDVGTIMIKGKEFRATKPKSFIREMKNLGAEYAVPINGEKLRYLIIGSNEKHNIKRYIMSKGICDLKAVWFADEKNLKMLDTFELFHEKTEKWVSCVQKHIEKPVKTKKATISTQYSKPVNHHKTTIKVEEVKDPWYLKPLIIIGIILFIIANMGMCNYAINDDRFDIETTIKSHGDY